MPIKTFLTVAALPIAVTLMTAPADAKGCIKGAVVGGVAGHVVHHGFLGAVTGCIAGRHLAKKREREQEMQAPPNGLTPATKQQWSFCHYEVYRGVKSD
jgi:uncharacterized protein YcfJ